MREAFMECFRAITCLKTEDLDIAAPPGPLIDILTAITAGAPSFNLEADGKISFNAPQGFKVKVDLIQVGDGCVKHLFETEPFLGGSVASKADLLRLRAITVVDRGGEGDVLDFLWLWSAMVREGQRLPWLDKEDLDWVVEAAVLCFPVVGKLALVAILDNNNSAIALQL
ncbi:hypothetical protein BD289DRAFT_362709 [Coniella lustricola]|uniref:Uncharacterized protein n=1 Tax=Coniella lustricola TaxID=2025994 RepID=A0A2T3AG88_9PEZI|nr:hypothetical protein BD289DRAFT_362709 [Coniella lustricola]